MIYLYVNVSFNYKIKLNFYTELYIDYKMYK